MKWLRNILQRRLQRKIDKKLKEIADTIRQVEEKRGFDKGGLVKGATPCDVGEWYPLEFDTSKITYTFSFETEPMDEEKMSKEAIVKMMNDSVVNEDYEAAAIYRDILNDR